MYLDENIYSSDREGTLSQGTMGVGGDILEKWGQNTNTGCKIRPYLLKKNMVLCKWDVVHINHLPQKFQSTL